MNFIKHAPVAKSETLAFYEQKFFFEKDQSSIVCRRHQMSISNCASSPMAVGEAAVPLSSCAVTWLVWCTSGPVIFTVEGFGERVCTAAGDPAVPVGDRPCRGLVTPGMFGRKRGGVRAYGELRHSIKNLRSYIIFEPPGVVE